MKVEVRDGIILIDHDDIISQYGRLEDSEIKDGIICVVIDGIPDNIPLDGNWGDWSEVIKAYDEMYPNGKPKPEVPPIIPTIDPIQELQLAVKMQAITIELMNDILTSGGVI